MLGNSAVSIGSRRMVGMLGKKIACIDFKLNFIFRLNNHELHIKVA